MKEKVKNMIGEASEALDKLELIDNLQRLGLAYHFEDEIKKIMEEVYNHTDNGWKEDDLYAVSLKFRLFRQHGLVVSSGTFKMFH